MPGYGDGAGSQGSQGGGGAGSGKKQTSSTLRPVTIKQILETTQLHADADFRIDDAEFGQITFIGVVRNIGILHTNITFHVEDGTGAIDVKQWRDVEAENKPNPIENDTYVRIIGILKSYNDRRHITCVHIRPITDFHEVLYHFAEATALHLHFTRGLPNGQSNGLSNGMTNGNGDMKVSAELEAQMQEHQLAPHLRQIIMTISHLSENTTEGISIQQVARTVATDVDSVKKSVDQLCEDGVLYTTIDDDHVRNTVS